MLTILIGDATPIPSYTNSGKVKTFTGMPPPSPPTQSQTLYPHRLFAIISHSLSPTPHISFLPFAPNVIVPLPHSYILLHATYPHNITFHYSQLLIVPVLCPFTEVKTEADLLPPGAPAGAVPTDLEQATGLERLEILGKMEGVDIFDMRPLDASRKG